MFNLKTTILAALAVVVAFASPAAARTINCPVDQVRTEITTDLPDGWWQTPQRGSLQNTRVADVGGEPTLICEYWAYGTTVSVMRRPPERQPICTAQEGGFDCRRDRPARAATTHSTGPMSIPQTWRADLDTGEVGSGTADFWFRAETARNRYLQPMNGARFGIMPGASGATRAACVATPKSSANIPVSQLTVGTYVCVRTSDGRHGVFRVNEPIGRSPGTMEIGYTLWN